MLPSRIFELFGVMGGHRFVGLVDTNLSFMRCRSSSATAQKVPITVPRLFLKKRTKKLRRSKQPLPVERNANKSLLMISCKRKEYNHYQANTYGNQKGEPIELKYLASGGWLHYKSKGDYFTINTHAKSEQLDKTVTFTDLGINDQLSSILTSQNIKHPSYIQSSAIPEILSLSNVICAAETGCGKTNAYLLPILQRLYEHRSALSASALGITSPRAVLLVPSSELANQLQDVVGLYSSSLDIRSLNLSQGSHTNRIIDSLKSKPRDVDILIATPGSLTLALRAKAINSSLVNHIVIDEADTLMDNSFNRTTVQLLKQLSTKSSGILGIQLILVSATMPKDLKRLLQHTVNIDGFTKCCTSQLHHVLGHVSQKFCRLGHADKPGWILNHLQNCQNVPSLVFANTCNTAAFLNHHLDVNDLPNVVLHGEIDSKERARRYNSFCNGEVNVLVCSDLASRGLDTGHVSQVINYNLPWYMSDYIHRVGRVGRLSSQTSGKVISLVGHRPEVNLVWQIEEAVRSNRDLAELPNVNANVKKHMKNHRLRKWGS